MNEKKNDEINWGSVALFVSLFIYVIWLINKYITEPKQIREDIGKLLLVGVIALFVYILSKK